MGGEHMSQAGKKNREAIGGHLYTTHIHENLLCSQSFVQKYLILYCWYTTDPP